MNILEELHGAEYVHTFENGHLCWAWHGGTIFNLYDALGNNLDCFTHYGVDNAQQAEEVIRNHIKGEE